MRSAAFVFCIMFPPRYERGNALDRISDMSLRCCRQEPWNPEEPAPPRNRTFPMVLFKPTLDNRTLFLRYNDTDESAHNVTQAIMDGPWVKKGPPTTENSGSDGGGGSRDSTGTSAGDPGVVERAGDSGRAAR